MKHQIILDTPMVKVLLQDATAYVVAIRTKEHKWALQCPYPADQRGLVAAVTLALDVLAGKIMLDRTVLDLNINNDDDDNAEAEELLLQASKQLMKP